MIRRAEERDRAAVEALWDYHFEKRDEPFFQFYFRECYRPEETLLYTTETGLAAALHLRHYMLSIRGASVPVTYIVGLATHPAARGRGYAGALLRAALAEGNRLGRYANILMPSAAGFYIPRGWSLYCHQWRRRSAFESRAQAYALPEGDIHYEWLAGESSVQPLVDLYRAAMAGVSGGAERDTETFARLVRGQLSEGHAVVAYEGAQPLGYVFFSRQDETLLVGEWIAPTAAGDRALYQFVCQQAGEFKDWVRFAPLDDASYLEWPDGAEHIYTQNETFPFMMIRIADVVKFWSQIPAAAAGALNVAVTLPEGATETYRVTAADGRSRVEPTQDAADVTTDIGTLGVMLIGRLTAGALARAGRLTGDAEAIALLDRLYPAQRVYINEWY